ncbi:hypothetical protein Ahy_B10g102982 [Arachis hypogaea]|uniref:Retrotransposon gag domain-containing protein n=1 Tax=Arachis hypogaea TaxID=3818 RepID=A0A444X307_ARAHY|nr:hypothetical protein Ahy_B10g102982 [Arachis hypogaea]
MNRPCFVFAFPIAVQMAEVPRGVKNLKIITKFAGEVGESTVEHIARYLVEIEKLANDENLKMKGDLNVVVTDLVALKRDDGESIDEYMICFKNARSRCYVSLPESEVVKIVTMGLGFYMRWQLLNVHNSDLAHLAEKVRQMEMIRKEEEQYKSERKLKSKSFSRRRKCHMLQWCPRVRDLILKQKSIWLN